MDEKDLNGPFAGLSKTLKMFKFLKNTFRLEGIICEFVNRKMGVVNRRVVRSLFFVVFLYSSVFLYLG